MRSCLNVVCLLSCAWQLACFCLVFPAAVHGAESPDLSQVVCGLGLHPEDPSYGFDFLASKPHQAAALIVEQLQVIKPGVYFEQAKTNQTRHVIACLRALRYITGKTFVAATKSKTSDDEKQFLDFDKQMHASNPSHKLHFFGVWMSRNADYVAPIDAQKTIIREWKNFVKEEGKSFNYKPSDSASKSMDTWYWYG